MTKEELLEKKISAISLGCDKNRVDLEHMLFDLNQFGFTIEPEVEKSQIVIINTCAFISSAIEEALDNINYCLTLKNNKIVEKIIVSGCLPQREYNLLKEHYPEIDYVLQLNENKKICEIISQLYGVEQIEANCLTSGRIITHVGKYAYLKISDGCSNGCAYCTIPRIRGRFKSIPIKELVAEVKQLVKMGYKEIILVAQDTARYGEDLYGEPKLIDLLDEIIKIKETEWIRLLYIYPEWVTDELLSYIKKQPKMCKYLDMPLQHIDNDILLSMNRRTNEEKSRQIIKNIKENYPEITIRSTFIIGFPGETAKQFKKLCNFIAEGNIDYATFFPYYREEKTKAYYMKKQVPNFIKKNRLKKIVKIQNTVFNNYNLKQLGTIQKVMIDTFENGQYIGHTQKDAPMVDFIIEIDGNCNKDIRIGQIYDVELIEMINRGFKGEIRNDTKSNNIN